MLAYVVTRPQWVNCYEWCLLMIGPLLVHQVFLHLKGLFLVSRILTVSLTPESIFHFLGHFSWSLPATYKFSCMVLSILQPFSSSIQIIVKFSTKSRNTYATANWLNGVEDSKLPTCIEPSLCLDIKTIFSGIGILIRPSYLHNGNLYTDKTASSYWHRPQTNVDILLHSDRFFSKFWIKWSALLQIMVWYQIGDKPLFKAMRTHFFLTYIHSSPVWEALIKIITVIPLI